MTNETDQNEVAINKGGKIKSKKSDSDKAIEDFLQNPETLNAIVIDSFKGNLFGERVELGGIIDSLQQSSEQLQSDTPLLLAERILMSQAQSLNAVFCDMAKRANRQEYVANMDKLLRLALKAQSQCRATLETLSNIKNPPVIFAKHANIAHNQQINNQQVNNSPQGTAQSEQTSEPVQQTQSAIEQQPKQAIPTVTDEKITARKVKAI